MKSNTLKLIVSALSLAVVTSSMPVSAGMKCGAGKCGSAMMKKHMPAQMQVSQKRVSITLPDVVQERADGKKVKFIDAINDGRPVILNFIFTTCKAICPISSSIFMNFQKKLGKDFSKVHMVSISIDPDQDTPSVLRKYAKEYHAKSGWDFYTGTANDSLAIQQAFDVYRGDKMYHDPVTFVRTAPGKTWLRINGFTTANALLQDYQKQLAANN